MNAPTIGAPDTAIDPWDARVLIAESAADLSRRFPGVVLWFGAATRHWFAMVEGAAGSWRLVEANGPHDLSQSIESARAAVRSARLTDFARPVIRPVRAHESRRRGRHERV